MTADDVLPHREAVGKPSREEDQHRSQEQGEQADQGVLQQRCNNMSERISATIHDPDHAIHDSGHAILLHYRYQIKINIIRKSRPEKKCYWIQYSY